MRAVGQRVFGGPEVLQEIELERPEAAAGEIVVRVRAAGVNPTDWKHRAGLTGRPTPVPVLGWDVSGTVAQVGSGVTLFAPGDDVFGMLPYPRRPGGYAEYATAPTRSFTRVPANLDHVGAAALPLAALTAHQALVDTADLQPGQRVLVHAAAGGVGHLAVQLAKARGAHVIGTAGAAKHDLLRRLGADELIDYRTTAFDAVLDGIDVVLDTLAGDVRTRSLEVLRPGGILVSLVADGTEPAAARRAAARGVRMAGLMVEADHAGMRAVAALVEQGELRPHIAATFPLADAAAAHALGERGRTTGKIVLTVD
ncbi:NADP-dependent oxidoreductase [Pseudonocardia sp. CA-107938]|uniref:NADP-dependent oxidoreductase n=1 Tax=Pseudonocardia sp. CA-107938 TaxID=3240021 RepID=UPI003D8ADFA8